MIENAVRDGRLATSIIGVGLNVNQLHFDPALPTPTSMLICEPNVTGYSREEVLHEYMNNFKRYCARYLNITGGYTRLGRLYLSSLWRFDEKASFIETSTDTVFVGKIKGVSGIGQLVIETEKGELKEFAFKEIGYII